MQDSNKTIIAHQVLFIFKDGYSWDSPLALRAEEVSHNHPNEIPQILAWSCGRSVVPRKQSVDFSLIGFFNDLKSLNEYMIHPDHQMGVSLWRQISTWTVSDIVVDRKILVGIKEPLLPA